MDESTGINGPLIALALVFFIFTLICLLLCLYTDLRSRHDAVYSKSRALHGESETDQLGASS